MKGQAQVVTSVAGVIFVVVLILIGLVVYGSVTDVVPHDRTLTNESICTTCINGTNGASPTTYAFDFTPILNDTTLVCLNDSIDLMTNGADNPASCLTYNIVTRSRLNITNTTEPGCQIDNVVCTYTYDEANANEQAFYDDNTSTTFSGYVLLAVLAVVIAAVVIVGLVMLFKA